MARVRISPARRIAYAFLTVVAVFCLAELTCWLLWDHLRIAGVFARDSTLRWVLPASDEIYVGDRLTPINSRGFRGPEVSTDRAPCTLRIFGTGDSSVFGHEVPTGAFLDLLPKILQNKELGGLRVETINGGVPGYSTYQTMLQLKHGGWDLRPDLLLVANLWSDGAASLQTDRQFFQRAVKDRGTFAGAVLQALGHSKLYTLAISQLHGPQVVYDPDDRRQMVPRVPLAEFRSNLRAMVTAARRRGGEAVLLILPHLTDQVALDEPMVKGYWREKNQEMAHDYRQVVRSLSKELGVVLLDLPRRVRRETRRLFLDDLHPNAPGHALIARELRGTLVQHPGLWRGVAKRCGDSSR